MLRRCFENGESVKSVSEEIGYSRASIYTWRKRHLQGGVFSLMNTKNVKPEKLPDTDVMMPSEEVESFRKQIYELQLEVDILKETINVLKKRPRRRLERPEEPGEGSGDRCREIEVPATSPASKDKSL